MICLKASTKVKTLLFADDTAVFVSEQNATFLKHTLTTEIKNIEKWLIQNKLTLNTSKSCYVMFGKKKYDELDNMVQVNDVHLTKKNVHSIFRSPN